LSKKCAHSQSLVQSQNLLFDESFLNSLKIKWFYLPLVAVFIPKSFPNNLCITQPHLIGNF